MVDAMHPDTLRKKRAKPAGACVNAYCHRPPLPGTSRCQRCRDYVNAWKRAKRKAGAS